MSKFEWVQLETLSAAVTHLQSRIEAARGTKNYGLVQLLETDLAAATERRRRVLAGITAGLSNASPVGTRPIDVPAQGRQPEEHNGNPGARRLDRDQRLTSAACNKFA
jgi:hypothetical protein